MNKPLMSQATAVWLIDNSTLSFQQISDFCQLHLLEIQAIADGTIGNNIIGVDPIISGQLKREEIAKAENDHNYPLKINQSNKYEPTRRTKGPKYTPLSKRQNRPDAIAWIIKNHPEVPINQIGKLLGTTKSTIDSIKEKTHWNTSNLVPKDPVSLGLCTQIDLDALIKKYAKKAEAKNKVLKNQETSNEAINNSEKLSPIS